MVEGLENRSDRSTIPPYSSGAPKVSGSRNLHPRQKQRPALKIRTKLLLLILTLLTIPWMGYKSVREMETFLLEGQKQALELTAEGISSLLNGRQDLFAAGVPEVVVAYETPKTLQESLPFDAPGERWTELLGPLNDYLTRRPVTFIRFTLKNAI